MSDRDTLLRALEKAPRPPASIGDADDVFVWLVDYMEWYFKVRGAAITPKDRHP